MSRPPRLLASLLGLWFSAVGVFAQATFPAAPAHHVSDNAGALRATTVDALNRRLETFESETSSQVVIALYPKLPPQATLEDYAEKLFQAWKIGQRGKDNGVLLLIFTQDRRMRIEVGYGLEGVLPDITSKRIIENEIAPGFRAGDYDGGVTAGVNAILAATKGEYRGGTNRALRLPRDSGTGAVMLFGVAGSILGLIIRVFTTQGLRPATRLGLVASGIPVGAVGFAIAGATLFRGIIPVAFVAFLLTLMLLGVGRRRSVQYDHSGRRRIGTGPGWGRWFGGGGGLGGFGGGFGGGGGGGFGGGGFSGGGGRSGGGGASGGW